jgi:hypothetical protein
MPSSDLILNVRQIAGYPAVSSALQSDEILIQRGGLGGPYQTIAPNDLVSTALVEGGDMTIGGKVSAQAFQGGSGQFSNVAAGQVNAQFGCFTSVAMLAGTIAGAPIASVPLVCSALAAAVPTMEQVAITALNALAPLSKVADGNFIELFVDGRPFFPVGTTPDFSVSGKVVTWLNTIFSLIPGSTVIAVYTSGGP